MSNNSQLNNIGEQMKGALNDALTTGNYDNLKSLVSDTVTSALNEAGAISSKAWQQKEEWRQQEAKAQEARRQQREVRKEQDFRTREQMNQEEWRRQREAIHREEWKRQQELRERQLKAAQAQQEARRQQELRQQQEARRQRDLRQQQNNALVKQNNQNTALMVNVKNKGLVPGILLVVFGGVTNIPSFLFALLALLMEWGAATTGVFVVCLVLSIMAICQGKKKIQLIDKAKRYVKLCGAKMYSEVEELAAQVGLKPKEVKKELRQILQKGIIPSAHMDKKGTHLMLNDVVYKQYTDAEHARRLREKEEKEQAKKKQKIIDAPVTEIVEEPKTELERMVDEGQEYIQKLRHLNDLIPGEAISNKLYRLEDLLREIFRRLEKEPAQMGRMHKVMDYYLPTTVKLVEAYHEFDVVSSPGEDIINAKSEIEGTLDTINDAFVELLNSLFQDKVFDVTTDAQVLQTMLASEGLTKEMTLTPEEGQTKDMDIMKVSNNDAKNI